MNYVDNPFKSPRVLSICTGLRGIERGIERAIGPVRTAAYVEIEAFICENLLAGMEAGMVDAAPIWCNLKTFDPTPFRGIVDGITGGYPCQPFSTAGERRGTEDPRHLWPFIKDIIGAIKPVWGFFENVSGHLTLGFDQVYRDLSKMGYAVEAGIFTAQEVGAPHQRERLFILAIRKDYMAYARDSGRRPYDSGGNENTSGAVWIQRQGAKTTGRPKQCCPNVDNASSIRCEQEYQVPARRYGSLYAGEDVAHTNSSRQQTKRYDRKQNEPDNDRTFDTGASEEWPARPGEQQYDWEAPRTIEPGLGITVNGYNFREDILRAAGNGVVEQTAELAFRTLLKKHGL